MNCNSAELYMNALLDDELPVKDSLEVVDHIESCKSCKTKWELNEETRSKLKHFIGSIKATDNFRKMISNRIMGNAKKISIVYLKPALIAASIAFLIGLGILNPYLAKMPTLHELHGKTNLQLTTSDIVLISEKFNLNLKQAQLQNLELASYKPQGATKIKKMFNRDVSIVSFKNNKGEKISLCILPENYKVSMCHQLEKNGVLFFCGYQQDCHYAYWKKGGKTVAFVSNSLSPEEMIDLALPLT